MHFPTKIPTLVGILMVVFIVGALVVGSESYFRSSTTASGSIQPANVHATNISDTAFTVTWTTELPATGALSVRSPKGTQVLFDDQDAASGKPAKGQGKYVTHSVTLRSASPNTDYDITILSNSKKNLDGEIPYRVRTASALSSASGNLEPAYGTILTSTGQPVSGAIVYLTVEGGQTLSTLSKPSGTWLIPLNLVRTQDLTGYLPITDRMSEAIFVESAGQQINATTDTLNDSPVPDMILGNTYDFRKLNAQAPSETLAVKPMPQEQKSPAAVLGTSTTKPANIVSLIIPADGAALPTTLPLIQGTGVPGKTVSLILGITNPVGDTTIVGANGLWSYTPKKPLAPGKQSVTMTTQDAANKPVAVTHMFEILKSGTQVLGNATPSAALTPTTTVLPTQAPLTTQTTIPESTLAAQEVPTSGNELPTITLLLIGISFLIGGGIILLR